MLTTNKKGLLMFIIIRFLILLILSQFFIFSAFSKETPQRIISLCTSGTEILATLGISPLGYALPGSGKLPDYLNNFIKNSNNVGSVATPSLERIKILNPDLILVDRVYENQSDYMDNLKKIAPVLNIRSDSYEEMMNNELTLAKILKKEQQANEFIRKFNVLLRQEKKQAPTGKNVLGIFISSQIIWAWTDQSFLVSLLKEANINYAYKGQGSKYYSDLIQISVDKILEINPDYLFVFDEPAKNSVSFLQQSPAWQYLKAVKENHVVKLDRDIWSRSKGPLSAMRILNDLDKMHQL